MATLADWKSSEHRLEMERQAAERERGALRQCFCCFFCCCCWASSDSKKHQGPSINDFCNIFQIYHFHPSGFGFNLIYSLESTQPRLNRLLGPTGPLNDLQKSFMDDPPRLMGTRRGKGPARAVGGRPPFRSSPSWRRWPRWPARSSGRTRRRRGQDPRSKRYSHKEVEFYEVVY